MRIVHRVTAIVLLGLLPIIAMEIYNARSIYTARQKEVQGAALRQAELASSEIERIIAGLNSTMLAISQAPAVRSFDTASCADFIAGLALQLPHVTTISVADASGQVRCAPTQAQIGRSVADRDYFKRVIADKTFTVGGYVVGRVSGKPGLPFALPLIDEKGNVFGAVISALDLDWLSKQLLSRGLPEDGSVTVADRDGVIVARQPLPERFIGTGIPATYKHLLAETAPGTLDVVSQDGTPRILGYIPLGKGPPGLYVSAGLSTERSFALLEAAARRQLGATILALLATLAGAYLLSHYFVSRPLDRLVTTVRQWHAGDLKARTGLTASAGEPGTLGMEFDRAMDQLQSTIDQLQAERDRSDTISARLRLAIRAADAGTWDWKLPDKQNWDRSYYELLGLDPDGEELTVERFMSMVHPDDREILLSNRRATLAGQPPRPTDEYRLFRPDGSMVWLRNFRMMAASGKRVIGVTQNVTASKATEAHIRLLLRELSHRVKNQYAVILAMLRETSRIAKNPAEFFKLAQGRIMALSQSHDLLVSNEWKGAALFDLVQSQMAGFGFGERLRATGPEVMLSPNQLQYLGMAFYELATNAAKHGALSTSHGSVTVSWEISGESKGERKLLITWQEQDGPAVEPQSDSGFGRKVLEKLTAAALGGKAELVYARTGLIWTLLMPRQLDRQDEAREESPAQPFA